MSNTSDPEFDQDLKFIKVCNINDISDGAGKSFKIGSLYLALFRTQNRWFATSDICSHEHEHLSGGWLEGYCIECPRHGAAFDLRTGEPKSLPATEPIEIFPVKIDGNDVTVGIPDFYLN